MHASEKYTERVQKLRTEYWTTIGTVNLEELVFIDEAGVNIAMTRRFARSPQGSRAYGSRPYGRGKNVTMIGAMSLEGVIAAMTFTGGTNASAFVTYVTQVLVPTLWPGACVVMDNFSSHQVTGIREAIEAVGARLVYLSPYSPDFSPIENCWSKLKEFLRRRSPPQASQAARTYLELDEAITTALDAVTKKDIIGWFTHCCYYIAPN
ncbi:IS630 family transposase [Nostoc sp.]|uniref:IS630 family transposase n=1 Tax=Nostoc sp. TaxID=1180 RepID=UPI002FF5F1A0